MAELTWDGSNYYAILENGKKLYVDGDAFSEARMDYITTEMKERHPEMDKEQIADQIANHSPETEKLYDEAMKELDDSSSWDSDAVEVGEDGEPLEPTNYNYSAWIQ